MEKISKPESPKFSPEKRLEFLHNLYNNHEEPFVGLDDGDFFRFLGVPSEIIIDELNQVPFEEKLQKARDIGLISTIKDKSWSYVNNDRPIVFTKVGGSNIPFYRSSEGTGGKKEAGIWYPFWGVGKKWLIKDGGEDNYKTCYDNPVLKKIQDILESTFNWDHNLDFINNNELKNHPLGKNEGSEKTFCPPMLLNETLFGDKSKNLNFDSHDNKHHEWIKELVIGMYERYPADYIKKIVDYNNQNLTKQGYIIKNTEQNLQNRI
ncbi:hypothetical protein A2467_00715 [Candidatus Nomurabacteria bacterium RIFOXYC2_FULL_36_8]|nr:MAG: hypothetical protein UR97_C0004G0015 [Candidatus Nomurabacteria bacterium GW2011_GWE2_36_115]KKP94146.1 MAG: hypothetical protein US00_C0003G0070 [Candidatus Nomurabacteria bacterium GW2011_GWF2_36_126]KKP96726.1 MAG: hypothetical protein US04_C0001G0228 [Candidatus Nomurabacteria bacterium GW2011_GWD2_36_14]KKP99670.1 MAG: hypothetical protein US08_C0001G0353 [Candidatus Nomurabacteria bacterium GW2011_GWF2_36_19]KKQ05385.1 MAG: hypothetical protein US17_C0005G0152 [Candidatus Nomuraba